MTCYDLSDILTDCLREHARVNTVDRGQTEVSEASLSRFPMNVLHIALPNYGFYGGYSYCEAFNMSAIIRN